jgi:tetratricopeptide (TPR) repeat protein
LFKGCSPPTALSQAQAISGLGGIGKTQIALEYAYRYARDYQAVLWTLADTRESLISGYTTLAELLDLPQKSEQDLTIIIKAVKTWLQTHGSWLLILDNADELTLVREFLPPTFAGHILLTTRAQAMGRLAQRLEVETMEPDIGALFLLDQSKYDQAELHLKRALAIFERSLWPGSPQRADVLDNLGKVYRMQGRYAQAKDLHERALSIIEDPLGQEHTRRATILYNLAELSSTAPHK